MGAVVIIAAAVRKERVLMDQFRRARAVTPQTATTAASLGVEPRHAWGRLARRGIIRPAPNGGYYLDESAVEAWNRARQQRATALLAIVLGLAVGLLMWTQLVH